MCELLPVDGIVAEHMKRALFLCTQDERIEHDNTRPSVIEFIEQRFNSSSKGLSFLMHVGWCRPSHFAAGTGSISA
jgi:hypothetical protein